MNSLGKLQRRRQSWNQAAFRLIPKQTLENRRRNADVRVDMGNHRDSCGQASDLAGHRAGDLLRAWISGDAGRFAHELESILKDPAGACDAGEEERRNLLKAVALRMKQCPDLFGQTRKAGIELCLNLLGHLVTEETGNTQSGRPGKTGYGSQELGGGIANGNRLCFRMTSTATAIKPTLRLI
jgi:hypothetical protein